MSEPSELLIATNNAGKVREISQYMRDMSLSLRTLREFPEIPEVEETGTTFAENATLKARQYSALSGLFTLSDDSGLEVAALGGAPGVYSARYAGPHATYTEKIEKLLGEIASTGDEERRARFVCVVALAEPSTGEIRQFEGVCDGRIAREPRGTGGFGYDPVFIPDGHTQTFGELPDEIKQTISHRAHALAQAVRFIRQRFLLNSRYLIHSVLGRGGFGQTYLVEDTHSPSRRLRVVKQLKPQSSDPTLYSNIKDRFKREAKILERLGDANDQIPALHAYFSEAGEFYLVQDWIDGQSLAQKVREGGPLSEFEVREFLESILPVLDFVHEQSVIHRDISPNNIMLRVRDGKPVLIDFGAVKEVVTTALDAHGFPLSTMAIGAPGYMPFEQQAGRPVFASDIFSLGLTAIFALTSKHPQQLHDLRTGDISWREHAHGVTQGLAEVLSKAVATYPQNRFLSARQMLDALRKDVRPVAFRDRPAKVFRISKSIEGKLPAEATTQLSEETVLRPDCGRHEATMARITEPAILIRINRNYRNGMSAEALYDATRGVWRVGARRNQVRYAMAVFGGEVLEVYTIEAWHPAGTTQYTTCNVENMRVPGRWEFTGRRAPEDMRRKYVGQSVVGYFQRGQQNPITYVNC